jgi:hypothetical protein
MGIDRRQARQVRAAKGNTTALPEAAPPVTLHPKEHVVTDLTKATWILGTLMVAGFCGVFSFFYSLKSEIQGIEYRVGTIEKWIKSPNVLPATRGVNSATVDTQPSSQEPSRQHADLAPKQPTRGILMGIPSSVAPRDPPACISRSSKRKFSCDRATNPD